MESDYILYGYNNDSADAISVIIYTFNKTHLEELETKFGVKCKFLFLETTFDRDKTKNEEQKKIMSELNEYGLINYFENIIPRKPKKKNNNE